MQFACFKEALSEQSLQPLRSSVVHFITQIKSQPISTNYMNDLISHNNNNNNNNNNKKKKKKKKKWVTVTICTVVAIGVIVANTVALCTGGK